MKLLEIQKKYLNFKKALNTVFNTIPERKGNQNIKVYNNYFKILYNLRNIYILYTHLHTIQKGIVWI